MLLVKGFAAQVNSLSLDRESTVDSLLLFHRFIMLWSVLQFIFFSRMFPYQIRALKAKMLFFLLFFKIIWVSILFEDFCKTMPDVIHS